MSNLIKSEVREVSFTLRHPFWPATLAVLAWLGMFAVVLLSDLLLGGFSNLGSFSESGLLITGLSIGVMLALVCCLVASMAFGPTRRRLYTLQLIEQLNQEYLGVSIRKPSDWEGELSSRDAIPLKMQDRGGQRITATAYRSKERVLDGRSTVCHYVLIIDSD